tara:strand:- start:351 stop:620 length:270 start_codon:yes stop_codon:yes gene_type:complete
MSDNLPKIKDVEIGDLKVKADQIDKILDVLSMAVSFLESINIKNEQAEAIMIMMLSARVPPEVMDVAINIAIGEMKERAAKSKKKPTMH